MKRRKNVVEEDPIALLSLSAGFLILQIEICRSTRTKPLDGFLLLDPSLGTELFSALGQIRRLEFQLSTNLDGWINM